MKKSQSVPTYPEVNAYTASERLAKERPDMKGVWLVPCPYCDRVHSHSDPGARGSHDRVPHCPHPESPTGFLLDGKTPPTMYRLKYAGSIDDETIFDEAAECRRAKYKAHYEGFADRRRARFTAYRIALQKGAAEITPQPAS